MNLSELREHFAERVYEIGGLSCAFNSTVYEDTLPYIPDLVGWAQKHIDKVHVIVFICYRAATSYGGTHEIRLLCAHGAEEGFRKLTFEW